MELKNYIEQGEKKTGSRKHLAEALEQNPNAITGAKAHRQGLPNYACIKLADLIGVDRLAVIAASELVTEKKPERKAVWHPFVQAAANPPAAAPSKTHTVSAGETIGDSLNSSPTPAQKNGVASEGKRQRYRTWVAQVLMQVLGVLVGVGVLLSNFYADEAQAKTTKEMRLTEYKLCELE
jgi:hypothetical protein